MLIHIALDTHNGLCSNVIWVVVLRRRTVRFDFSSTTWIPQATYSNFTCRRCQTAVMDTLGSSACLALVPWMHGAMIMACAAMA